MIVFCWVKMGLLCSVSGQRFKIYVYKIYCVMHHYVQILRCVHVWEEHLWSFFYVCDAMRIQNQLGF